MNIKKNYWKFEFTNLCSTTPFPEYLKTSINKHSLISVKLDYFQYRNFNIFFFIKKFLWEILVYIFLATNWVFCEQLFRFIIIFVSQLSPFWKANYKTWDKCLGEITAMNGMEWSDKLHNLTYQSTLLGLCTNYDRSHFFLFNELLSSGASIELGLSRITMVPFRTQSEQQWGIDITFTAYPHVTYKDNRKGKKL